jgi:TPR repeat protein
MPDRLSFQKWHIDQISGATMQYSISRLLVVIAVFNTLLLGLLAGAYAQAINCHALAALPSDPNRKAAGVLYDRLNAQQAVPACMNAVRAEPQNGQLWFQLGRALEKDNRLADAIVSYQEGIKFNNPGALNNLGELYRDAKGVARNLVLAESYFSRSASQQFPEGIANLKQLQQRLAATRGSGSQTSVAQGISAIDGVWYSGQWQYGYELKNGVGQATQSNSPSFSPGDRIVELAYTAPGEYAGRQIYRDGKFYRVTATLRPDGRLYFQGEKNVTWTMDRVQMPVVAATPATPEPPEPPLPVASAPVRAPEPPTPIRTEPYTLVEAQQAVKRSDYKTAAAAFKELAEKGETEGQVGLGLLHLSGQGVEKDINRAIEWFRLAAAQGNRFAQNKLGEQYKIGEGVERDYAQAYKWFKLSADQAFASAQSNLGQLYQFGLGVTADEGEAIKWFKLAADQGNSLAKSSLAAIDKARAEKTEKERQDKLRKQRDTNQQILNM